MTAALIALTLLALILPAGILFAWHLDGRRRSDDLREVRADHARDRQVWDRERQILLNRIQPATAQTIPDLPDLPGAKPVQSEELPQAPDFDNDKAYWESTESTEEMAARMMREELDERNAAVAGVAGEGG